MWDSGSFSIIAIGLFFSILFIQSGLDKAFNRQENLVMLKDHFANTFLRGAVPILLGIITLFELAAGLVSAYGIIMLHFGSGSKFILYGLYLSVLTLLMLFFGQRVANDHKGSETVTIYFAVAVLSLIYLS